MWSEVSDESLADPVVFYPHSFMRLVHSTLSDGSIDR